ncbi:HNH endonuclease [Microbacterium sp. 1P10UB]|uniref:HNH endonuclease signature motif containing protein n=1 Tax=unclassified Microbacterium TaxID=2609290 RepID=UPI0039A24F1D
MEDVVAIVARMASAMARVNHTVEGGPLDALDDQTTVSLIADAAEVRKSVDLVLAAAAAVVDQRSDRDRGVAGLARQNGHRSATSLLQSMTGQSRSDVTRALRTGRDLLGHAEEGRLSAVGAEDQGLAIGVNGSSGDATPLWRTLLRAALTEGRITTAQHEAIRVGMGDPPLDRSPDSDPAALTAAWARSTETLLEEAGELSVEDLRHAARIARDRLDPLGVARRFAERFAARSFRRWADAAGQQHAHLVLDDESAAWIDAIGNAALRPRRGPRFVDAGGSMASSGSPDPAASAVHDPRTNEQLQYDLVMAVLRAGAAVDPNQAFGDRQPGVRVIVESPVVASDGEGVAHLEDGGDALPRQIAEKYLCDAGARIITTDVHGRPLDVGREHRTFTPKQRVAISVRDGGCVGRGCSAPPSWCEMHHIDHWYEHHGRTDVDDGVPLCRFHHLDLHNRGARIVRRRDPESGDDTYWWQEPADPATGVIPAPERLRSRSPRRFEAA